MAQLSGTGTIWASAILACAAATGQSYAQTFHYYYPPVLPGNLYATRARDLQIVADRILGAKIYMAANAESGMITRFKSNGSLIDLWRYQAQVRNEFGECIPHSQGAGVSIDTIDQTSDGGYIVGITTHGPDGPDGYSLGYNVGLMRINATGAVIWSALYRGNNLDPIHKCQPGVVARNTRTAQGVTNGHVLCYSTSDNDPDGTARQCGVLLKTDTAGNLVFFTRVRGQNDEESFAVTDVEVTSFGFAVTGSLNTAADGLRPVYLEFNPAGNLINAVRYKHVSSFTENRNATAHGIAPTANGDFMISIGVNNTPRGDAALMRIQPGGAVVWSNSWETSAGPGYQAIHVQNIPGFGERVAIAGPCIHGVNWGIPGFALTCDAATGGSISLVKYDSGAPGAFERGFDAVTPRIGAAGWAFAGDGANSTIFSQFLLATDPTLSGACPLGFSVRTGADTVDERIVLPTDSHLQLYKWCIEQYTDPRAREKNGCGQ